jgi:hypothetical protein
MEKRSDAKSPFARFLPRFMEQTRWQWWLLPALSSAILLATIPTHLLTKEAGLVYLRHLKQDGALAIHITNSHVDLRPIVRGLAGMLRLQAQFYRHKSTDWAVLRAGSAPSTRRIIEWTDQKTAFCPCLSLEIRPVTDDYHQPLETYESGDVCRFLFVYFAYSVVQFFITKIRNCIFPDYLLQIDFS